MMDEMTDEMELAEREILMVGKHPRPSLMKKRSLGGAIFLVAIADYRGTDELEHNSAKQFLYPQTHQWKAHYDWVVGLADELNPAWLRGALDRFRGKWDGQRAARIAREMRRNRRNHADEDRCGERIQSKGRVVPRRNAHASFQPAGEACSARGSDAAPGL
jgi:hypothetical protein